MKSSRPSSFLIVTPVFLLLVSLLTIAATPAAALEIDPELRAAAKASGEAQDMMILLADRPDVEALEASVRGRSFEYRRDTMMAALREHAAVSQATLLQELSVATKDGLVENLRSSWLANAVFVRGGESLLDHLAQSKAQGWVSADPARMMIEAAEGSADPNTPPVPGDKDESESRKQQKEDAKRRKRLGRSTLRSRGGGGGGGNSGGGDDLDEAWDEYDGD